MSLEGELTDLIARNENGLGLALLGLAAFIEYVFPPFPGDALVVFGAFLVVRRGWPLPAVFGMVLLGSAAGFMIDYQLGRALARGGTIARRFGPRLETLERVAGLIRRFGPLALVLNRFVPTLRALFFVAAGWAGLRPLPVLLYGVVSAALWNAVLFAVGRTVGSSWERLRELARLYGWAVGLTVAVALVIALVIGAVRRRRRG